MRALADIFPPSFGGPGAFGAPLLEDCALPAPLFVEGVNTPGGIFELELTVEPPLPLGARELQLLPLFVLILCASGIVSKQLPPVLFRMQERFVHGP